MNISNKQIKELSKYIIIADVKSYIEEHLLEYEQFLKEEQESRNECST